MKLNSTDLLRIIYPAVGGQLAVIIPAPECRLSLEDIARKDVPAGVPYKFVTIDDLPQDRDFRSAWEADFTNPDGYGIGSEAWFAEQEEA
jgi:hypothetical protein